MGPGGDGAVTVARAALGVAGLGLMAYATYGLVTAAGLNLAPLALFGAALVLGHEAILMPAAIAVGWVAVRVVPPWARPAAQVALVVTLALTVVAIPSIVLTGAFPDNPSLLPRDYRQGLLIAVGATWLIAAAAAAGTWWRWRRAGVEWPDGDAG